MEKQPINNIKDILPRNNYSKEEIDKVIQSLSPEEIELLKRMYGIDNDKDIIARNKYSKKEIDKAIQSLSPEDKELLRRIYGDGFEKLGLEPEVDIKTDDGNGYVPPIDKLTDAGRDFAPPIDLYKTAPFKAADGTLCQSMEEVRQRNKLYYDSMMTVSSRRK